MNDVIDSDTAYFCEASLHWRYISKELQLTSGLASDEQAGWHDWDIHILSMLCYRGPKPTGPSKEFVFCTSFVSTLQSALTRSGLWSDLVRSSSPTTLFQPWVRHVDQLSMVAFNHNLLILLCQCWYDFEG